MIFVTSKQRPSSGIDARAIKLQESFKNLYEFQWALLDKFNSEFTANWREIE
jgi:hypothetical protein